MSLFALLLPICMMRQILNAMHQTKQMPLRIHLLLTAQREMIEPLFAE